VVRELRLRRGSRLALGPGRHRREHDQPRRRRHRDATQPYPHQRASLDADEPPRLRLQDSSAGRRDHHVAAVAPELASTGGHYLDDAQAAYTVGNDATLDQHPHGVKEWSPNPALAEQLWDVSINLLHT